MLIRYKCRCMKDEREIVVTDRVKGSDIGAWMQLVVTPSLTYDHGAISRNCYQGKMEYTKIPLNEETGEVGVQETRN